MTKPRLTVREMYAAPVAVRTGQPFQLPFRVDFDLDGPRDAQGAPLGTRPGRGNAGWTVATFPSREDAVAFMALHREAEMPCWKRIEAGEL